MTRKQKRWSVIAIGLSIVIVLLLIISELFSTDKAPTKVTQSVSENYSRDGMAAWAKLLARQGHEVTSTPLSNKSVLKSISNTLILVDAQRRPSRSELADLKRFIESGGQLVLAGSNSDSYSDSLLGKSLFVRALGPKTLTPSAQSRTTQGVRRIQSEGKGSLLGDSDLNVLLHGRQDGKLVSVAVQKRLGSGLITYIADKTPLQNGLIDQADNSDFAANLGGSKKRKVFFVDSSAIGEEERPSEQTGLNALSTGWKAAIIGIALALLIWMFARGHRFGPPEKPRRALPPPRQKFVEAQAASLSASKQPGSAVYPLWEQARQELSRRCGLGENPSNDSIRAAGEYAELNTEEIESLITEPIGKNSGHALLVGQAFAKLIGAERKQ